MKALQELLVFTGVVLAATLLYNIVCFLVFEGFQERFPPITYTYFFFVESLFFVFLGVFWIIFALLSTSEIERDTYQLVEGEIWMEKRVLIKILQSRRDVLLRVTKGVILIIIGLLFFFLVYYPNIYSH